MKKTASVFISFFSLICLLSGALFVSVPKATYTAIAATSGEGYTDVMTDFAGTGFDIDDYPVNNNVNAIDVIQVAEGKSGELFVYVYQPNLVRSDLDATSIDIGHSVLGINYKLSLISKYSTVAKYIVNDYKVSTVAPKRTYNVTTIYRKYISGLDTPDQSSGGSEGPQIPGSQTQTEKGYDVNKQFIARTVGENVEYGTYETEVVTVTDKFVGFVRLGTGGSKKDRHFVAFSTDKPIDSLEKAEVYFTSQTYRITTTQQKTFGEIKDNNVTLEASNTVYYNGFGFAPKYEWSQIQTVEECLNTFTGKIFHNPIFNVDYALPITDSAKEELRSKDWVLNFTETDFLYTSTGTGVSSVESGTSIGDVTILRLVFQYDGVVYDMGVIDTPMTGSDKPLNSGQGEVEVKPGEWLQGIIDTFSKEDNDCSNYANKIIFYVEVILGLIVVVVLIFPIVKFIMWLIDLIRGK